MPRSKSGQLPSPKNVNGYARVWHPIEKRHISLGDWGSQKADIRWRKLAADYLRNPAKNVSNVNGVLIAEIVAAYIEHLQKTNASKNVIDLVARAGLSLATAYGECPVSDFGPVELKTWASWLSDPKIGEEYDWKAKRFDGKPARPLAKRTIKSFARIAIRCINFGIGQDLYRTEDTRILDLERTDATSGLATKSPVKRYPVQPESIDAIMGELTPTLRATVTIQRLTGMRSTEMLSMRPMDLKKSGVIFLVSGARINIDSETTQARARGDIKQSESVWFYVPESHKTEKYDIDRVIPILPKVQAVLNSLPPRPADKPFISPKESASEFRATLRKNRKSKVQPSQKDRRKKRPKLLPGDQYEQRQYRKAIVRACERAGVPRWSPHQLRHSAITIAVDGMGSSRGAQQLAGHSSSKTTEVYTAVTMAGAVAAAAKL